MNKEKTCLPHNSPNCENCFSGSVEFGSDGSQDKLNKPVQTGALTPTQGRQPPIYHSGGYKNKNMTAEQAGKQLISFVQKLSRKCKGMRMTIINGGEIRICFMSNKEEKCVQCRCSESSVTCVCACHGKTEATLGFSCPLGKSNKRT